MKSILIIALLVISGWASASHPVTIPEGTDVHLRMLETVSSANAVEGQRFNLEVDGDLRVNGELVVPSGTKAVGTVVAAKKRGFMGRGGDLNVSLDYIILGEQRIRLRATTGKEGKDKVGTAVVLTVLFGPLGLLKRGHDISIDTGSELTAYVDQSTLVNLSDDVPPAASTPQAESAPTFEAPAPMSDAPALPSTDSGIEPIQQPDQQPIKQDRAAD